MKRSIESIALCLVLAAGLILTPAPRAAASQALGLVLPTDNTALFSKEPWKFYMYTTRNFEGKTTTPWEGGQYGFSRNAKRTAAGLIYTKFHEGIDIRPVRRSSDGTPLDVVRSIAKGVVVYTNATSSRSNYGNYVVVKHDWGDGPFYSVYAHLMSIAVKSGQSVSAGTTLGRLGYTGAGIDKTRSHVHVELNLFLSSRFPTWHDQRFNTPNHHSTYNGLNLAGLDIAGLFQAHRANPKLSLPDFIGRMSPYYKVLVPNRGPLEIVKRYPWLDKGGRGGASWEIALSRSGFPLGVTSSATRVSAPAVSWVAHSPTYHSYNTIGRLTGSGSSAGLSASGLSYIQLLTGQF